MRGRKPSAPKGELALGIKGNGALEAAEPG